MADVELIKQVVDLLAGGMSIGQVRRVLDTDASDNSQTDTASHVNVWANHRQRLLKGITEFDEVAVSETYNEVLSLYPIDITTHKLIVPLLQELGLRWQQGGEGRVAEEHFFSVFLRNKLGARFHHRSQQAEGPRLIAACLPGEQHEVGLLLFALVAQDWDYSVVLLGANTPLAEITPVVSRIDCRGIVLSGADKPAQKLFDHQLPEMVEAAGVPVFIGGRITDRFADKLAATGAVVLGSDLHSAMRKINSLLLRQP